jgi:hypothetical protein
LADLEEIGMRLQTALEFLSETLVPEQLDRIRASVDPEWIEDALAATGTATLRRRRLPAEQVIWLVIGIALLRNKAIETVVDELDLALPGTRGSAVAKSAIAQARQRLGDEPLAYLFSVTADAWAATSARRHAWRGLALYGADGTTLRVADSPENREAFGAQGAGADRGVSGYPLVRLVALMSVRSHLLSAVRFGSYKTGEPTLAHQLWRELPDDSLTIVDRNFLVADELTHLESSGRNRHWLTRAKKQTRLRVIEQLGSGDTVVEIELSAATRKRTPGLPPTWRARAIHYQKKGFQPSVLLTSLLDAKRFPAKELIELYHERWELEISYDEVKTHMLDRQESIRSRTVAGVHQELWGIAIAYNLVRLEMERAADEFGVPPTRISFVYALSLIQNELRFASAQRAAPGAVPKNLAQMRANMTRLVLPPRRDRTYPRAVKLKMSNYPRKRPTGTSPK